MKHYRALPRAAAALAVVTLLAGCVGTETAKEPAAATSAKPSPPLSPQAKAYKTLRDASIKNLKADGVAVSEKTRKNKYGKFPVLEVKPGKGIGKFDPAILKANVPAVGGAPTSSAGLPRGWTKEDAAAAHAFAADVLVDRLYNAPSNGDKRAQAATKKLVATVTTPELYDKLKDNFAEYGVIVLGPEMDADPRATNEPGDPKLDSIYDGKTPRIGAVDVRAKAAGSTADGLAFYFEGPITWNAIEVDKNQPYTEKIDWQNVMTVAKDGDGYLLNGIAENWKYSEEAKKFSGK